MTITNPTEHELAMIQEEFSLHPLSIEDTLHRGQRPKVEVFPNYFFLVLHAVSLDDNDELIDSEVHAFAGHRYLITIRYAPEGVVGALKQWGGSSGATPLDYRWSTARVLINDIRAGLERTNAAY